MEDVDRAREVAGAAARNLADSRGLRFRVGRRRAAAIRSQRALCRGHREPASPRADVRVLLQPPAISPARNAIPGYCRDGARHPGAATATRLRVEPETRVLHRSHSGRATPQDVASVVGDAILKRRDGFFSYLLAVVVDDAAQGVTHVVRGADLLDDTPRQIYLQRAPRLPTPQYAHVPVLVEPDGSKLAKSARSLPADRTAPRSQLLEVLRLLRLGAAARARAARRWASSGPGRRHIGPQIGFPSARHCIWRAETARPCRSENPACLSAALRYP